MNATREQWRPVVGFEGLYEVSDLGRVRTVPRLVSMGRGYRTVPGRIRKYGHSTTHGYLIVGLSRPGKRRATTALVHRLVLEAFVGPCPDGMEACHFDGDKTNNRLPNLRWDTRRANQDDAIRIGKRLDPNRSHCAKGHPLTSETTYVNPRGVRECRTCRSVFMDRYVTEINSGEHTVVPRNPDRSHCRHGHLMSESNVYVNKLGVATCRECSRARSRAALHMLCMGRYAECR
ncbi:HNH endonuclease [Mycobacteroides abscessus subsp. abscessus]|uniref:NUMOD4 motif-containing HNH endonuclease n=1 Tax=Mycobacteroides abscessus TaxID=36809 RepID=UPI0019D067AE|nr:HNH endonuclease [Mycobacteroides abscessus subsp. abscessus]